MMAKPKKRMAKVTTMAGRKRGRPRKNPLPSSQDPAAVMDFPQGSVARQVAQDIVNVAQEVNRITLAAGSSSTDILLPSPEDSVKVLAELAKLNDQAQAAEQKYLKLKEQTKSAKEEFDSITGMVLRRLRACTHKSDLPLFAEQQEQDLARMVAGNGSSDAPSASRSDDPPAEGVQGPPPVSEASTGVLDDSGVF